MKKSFRMGKTKKKLLEFIKEMTQGGALKEFSAKELIEKGWSGSYNYLAGQLPRLAEEGYLRRLRHGVYELVESVSAQEEKKAVSKVNEYISLVDALISRKKAGIKKTEEELQNLKKELKKKNQMILELETKVMKLESLRIKLEKQPELVASIIRESKILYESNPKDL